MSSEISNDVAHCKNIKENFIIYIIYIIYIINKLNRVMQCKCHKLKLMTLMTVMTQKRHSPSQKRIREGEFLFRLHVFYFRLRVCIRTPVSSTSLPQARLPLPPSQAS